MLTEALQKKNLFYRLYLIDKASADFYRQQPCPKCGGPLYFGNYFRKPRGEPEDTPEEYFLQFSLCCGITGCRRRLTPPSCRFLGQKVYWFPVLVSVVSDWQNGFFGNRFMGLVFETGISRHTLKRWVQYFKDTFPASSLWRKLRGQVPACVSNTHLPSSLVNFYLTLKTNAAKALIASLTFLSGRSCSHSKIRAG